MEKIKIKENFIRINHSGFYLFLKWYDKFIGDCAFKDDNPCRNLEVYDEYMEIIAYRVKNPDPEPSDLEETSYYYFVGKALFQIMKDFDFKNTCPRKSSEIIKDENGKTFLKTITLTEQKIKETIVKEQMEEE